MRLMFSPVGLVFQVSQDKVYYTIYSREREPSTSCLHAILPFDESYMFRYLFETGSYLKSYSLLAFWKVVNYSTRKTHQL